MKSEFPELDRLLNRLADETATAGDLQTLESLLLASPEARRRYLRFQDLHAELAQRAEAQAAAALPEAAAPAGRIVEFQNRRSSLHLAWAAAAVLTLTGAGALLWNSQKQTLARAVPEAPAEPAAVIALTHDATLADGRKLLAGAEIPPGSLHLIKGELGLRFASGAEATLRAPARFEIVSAMELRVDEGGAAVRAPDPVNGFTVRTPGGALVDLGTEFAMNVLPDGSSRMLVREGKVVASLVGPGGSSTRELTATAGQMILLDGNSGRLDPAPVAATDFPERLKLPAPLLQPGPGFESAMRGSTPLAWWRFSKAENGVVPNEMSPGQWDAKAIGNAAIEEVSPDNSGARLGGADGTAGFLVAQPFPGLAENNVFSIELWACADSPGQTTLAGLVLDTAAPPSKPNQERHLSVMEIMPSTPNQSGLIHGPNALRFLHRLPSGTPAGCNAISDVPVTPGRWHHLVGTCDGHDLQIYLDGEPVQKVPAGPQSYPGAFKLILGKLRAIPENRERAFKGWIDEAALHRRALPAAEVAAHYQAMEIK
ncbi:MAG: LamG-like jellyroll fold domain-containing protein [Verrucomicrobiota bacterium]